MTSFRQRASQLQRQGARAWRAAPVGAIPGYDRSGSILLRAARHLVLIFGGAVLLATLTAVWAGYGLIEPQEARTLATIRSRALNADDVDVLTQVPQAVIQAVDALLRANDPPAEPSSPSAVGPVWTPDKRRLERLSQLTTWLSARDGQQVYNLLDRLNRVGAAAANPVILSAYEQVSDLSRAESESLFGIKGNFTRIVSMLDQFINTTNDVGSLSAKVSSEKQSLRLKTDKFRLEIEQMTSDYNAMVADMNARRSRLSAFRRCYSDSIMISR